MSFKRTTPVKAWVSILKPNETFTITADTISDPQVVNATTRAAFSIGAKPMIIWHTTPLDLGKNADSILLKLF